MRSTVVWSWFVRWGRSVVNRGFVHWLVGIITWGSFVCYFYNISRVSISSVVFYMLSTAIRKDNAVFSIGGVSITGLVSSKVYSSIFISYSVFILVFCWYISVGWFMVRRGVLWGMVRWGRVVDWSWMVDWCWLVDRSWMVNRGWFVGGSWVAWGMSNSMAVSSRVSVFYCSMTVDISISYGQEGNKSDERL